MLIIYFLQCFAIPSPVAVGEPCFIYWRRRVMRYPTTTQTVTTGPDTSTSTPAMTRPPDTSSTSDTTNTPDTTTSTPDTASTLATTSAPA